MFLDFKLISFKILISILGIIILLINLSILMRFCLSSNYPIFTGDVYNSIITIHGIIAIFLFLTSFYIYWINLYLTCLGTGIKYHLKFKLMKFILNIYIILEVIFLLSIKFNLIPLGWTLYPPLSIIDNFITKYQLIILLFIECLTTHLGVLSLYIIITNKILKLSIFKLPMYIFATLIGILLFTLSIPYFLIGIVGILLNQISLFNIFDKTGNVLLYQHLFWLFGHPEVYVLAIPAFGIVSSSILGNKELIFSNFGFKFASLIIIILSALVWGHHMLVSGITDKSKLFFSISSLLIAIPTGIKVFTWLVNIKFKLLGKSSDSIISILFLIILTIGGFTGITLAIPELNLQFHDTQYVVSHFHIIMALGSSIGFLIIYLRFINKYINNSLYKFDILVQSLLFIVISIIFFIILGINGLNGQARRMPDLNIYNYKYNYYNFVYTFFPILFIIHIIIKSINSCYKILIQETAYR